MILKVDNNLDNPVFNIGAMRWFETSTSENFDEAMIFTFEARDVKYAYTKHDYNFAELDYVSIKFKDNSMLEVYPAMSGLDNMKYAEKLVNEIFKMKMLGTKWAEENPHKYI